MLIDSDVLIWLTRGHVGAAQRLSTLLPWRISVVTYIELMQGCRDKVELTRLKKGLAARNTEVLQITPAISQRAAELVEDLALSHGMRLADALIGATAGEHGISLLTANAKHFGVITGSQIDVFAP
ncbi:type II toxin-antitoxin system VapC family toxin [Azohydromonas caseinilytica]|uniref:Ribonuclease VapC n=1 Tax=Azohydromonas caseinilytica TaxID=2728836 RepID=A0A848F3Z3_9BURK|nr:type II toxin-antitoxin system VapC family toxin [Azohydromonas caseinilytica]NML13425.1 type II toxin-antitoxin system VapC family toxin [Azohydromonas caseinilytica]